MKNISWPSLVIVVIALGIVAYLDPFEHPFLGLAYLGVGLGIAMEIELFLINKKKSRPY